MAQTNEYAFESAVEQMLLAGGWLPGTIAEWDQERAIFPAQVCSFIAETHTGNRGTPTGNRGTPYLFSTPFRNRFSSH